DRDDGARGRALGKRHVRAHDAVAHRNLDVPGVHHPCPLSPAALMTFSHLVHSSRISRANSSGVDPTLSTPSLPRLSFIAGVASVLTVEACSLAMMLRGVFGGASI